MTNGKTLLNVICKNTGEHKELAWDDINDACTDDQGAVIVFGIDMEPYYLLLDKNLLDD